MRRNQTLWAVMLLLAVSATAFGQQVLRGSVAGTVKDDTGAALPGVTVTVTSPALQVPQILRVSDERGEYQVPDLPAGSYRVSYELAGFGTLVREGIVLTTGFNARVDVVLQVATVAETITVSGETPLVDVTSTRGGTTVSKDLIAAIPSNRNMQDLTVMVGGLVVLGPPMTGQIVGGRGGFRGISTYGQRGAGANSGIGTQVIEGVKMSEAEVVDFSAFEEVDVKTFGNTADVALPGLAVQYIAKSGSNQFHGRYQQIFQHHRFGSSNVDDALRAQGIATGDQIQYYSDSSADLGGRIVRDKLWFYGAFRDYRNKTTGAGYAKDRGPDGIYGTLDDTPAFPKASHNSITFKISYQATTNHRFISFGQYNPDFAERPSTRFVPFESNRQLDQLSQQWKPIEWQGTLNNRLFVETLWGLGGYPAISRPLGDWAEGSREPSRLNRATGQFTGPAFGGSSRNTRGRNQGSGRLSYLPAGSFLGSHELQTGFRVWAGGSNSKNPFDQKYEGLGEYQLIYDTVGGVPYQPAELVGRNDPLAGRTRQNMYAWYGMDSWRVTNRLTLNLGLRWDRQVYFVPEQVKVQGTFGTSGTFPQVDAGAWSTLAPRAGVALDLAGDGKTVLKGTYGWFNHDLELAYPDAFSQNTSVTYTYRWRDLNGDGNYQPGEVNLGLNGPDFLRVTGATNNRVNPDLELPHTHEATVSLERELGQGIAIRTLFVYKKVVNDYQNVNHLRPFSVWNQQFTRQDPGPDGVLRTADDGAMVTFYDYDPAYRGAAFVQNMNTNTTSEREDSFRNVELTLTKRPTGRWFANTSILVTKNHRWLTRVPQSPNDEINALDETLDWRYNLAAGYEMPYGIRASTLYSVYSGLARQRIHIFRAVDPAGGRALPSSGTITLPMEPYGTKRLPIRNILNLRGEKAFRLGGRRLTAGVDMFNALNTNTAWSEQGIGAVEDLSGPSYGHIIRVVYPRILRFGVSFEF